jgi:predicted Rossmann fold flavoprotein
MVDTTDVDIAIVGAGAAGLMAGISAGRKAREAGRPLRIVALDGAAKIGVKILVAGGGRCNVTHHEVTERDFAGGSRNAIRSVLRRFDVSRTIEFFRELGVELKREDTGKLFPVTDRAQTVLDALLGAAKDAGVRIRHPARVRQVTKDDSGFIMSGDWGSLHANQLILATGGKAMPGSGSDGGGYSLARALGHTLTPHVLPALVPLVLAPDCPIRQLSGLTVPARIDLHSGTGKRIESFTDSTLCTHFGLSGPAAMDMSRHYLLQKQSDPDAYLTICWLPGVEHPGRSEHEFQTLGTHTVSSWLRQHLPNRLTQFICDHSGIDAGTTGAQLTRAARRALLESTFEMRLPVTGDRGFKHAECTAGGIPLNEIAVSKMVSRIDDRLHFCGEICDVDGRIGGFNFQWAWSSGYVAGTSAAASILSDQDSD